MRHAFSILAASLGCIAIPGGHVAAETLRRDFTVQSPDGLRIFVRELLDTETRAGRGPMLMVNGGRSGVLASWDVDAPGSSTAEEIAKAGHHVYLMDVRGFGRSDFPEEMAGGRMDMPVAVRSNEAIRDIAAVIDEIRQRHSQDEPLSAIGWATGSQWLGHYASLYPKHITHLIYYNAAYGGPAGGWPLQEEFGDAGHPAELDYPRHGSYRLATAENLAGRWRAEGMDAAFLDRYVALSMEGDKTAGTRDPASFRFPSGPTADTLKMVNGRQLFDASFIRSHVLILRSANDFWSRPVDAQTMLAHLTSAASAEFVEIPEASHYVHLQPSADRQKFLDAVLTFTAKADRPGRPKKP